MAPSQIYVRNKEKSANEVGLKSEVIRYPDVVVEKEILDKLIAHCNANSITIATGVSAQIDQAYSLNLISRATEEVHKFPE